MYIRRKVFSILTDEMGEERLYSVNETLTEEERIYFLGEHRGKFSKGGTASGVVFTGEDVLNHGAESRLHFGPQGTNGGKALDYYNLETTSRANNARDNERKSTLRKLRKIAADSNPKKYPALPDEHYDYARLRGRRAAHEVYDNARSYHEFKKTLEQQKFDKTGLGKFVKKVKDSADNLKDRLSTSKGDKVVKKLPKAPWQRNK